MHFLHQGSTPPQTAPMTGDQVFKYMSQWDICQSNHLRHPTIALSSVFFWNIFLPFFPTTTTKLYFSKSPRTSTAKFSGIATIFYIIDDFYLKWLLGCMHLAFLFYSLITKSQSLLLVLSHFPKGVHSWSSPHLWGHLLSWWSYLLRQLSVTHCCTNVMSQQSPAYSNTFIWGSWSSKDELS